MPGTSCDNKNDSLYSDASDESDNETVSHFADNDPYAERAEEVLKKHVKLSYLKSLSPYNHLSLRSICSNWLKLQELGECMNLIH